MTRNFLATIGVAALMIATPTSAQQRSGQFVTGNRLHEWCTASATDPAYYAKDAQCTAFVMGVHDAALSLATVNAMVAEAAEIPYICTPVGVTAGQIRDIAQAYLREHPESRHGDAAIMTMVALMDAFPCTD